MLVADSSSLVTQMGDSGGSEGSRRVLRATWETAALAPKTISGRLRAFDRAGGDAATRESVSAYLLTLEGLATRRGRLSDLRCAYRILIHLGLMGSDPTIGMPRVKAPRWSPRPLTVDEVGLLMDVRDEELSAWFRLALYAGLRASEIASLEADQLERWDAGWALRIVGKGRVEAVIPAHELVVEIMRHRTGRLWPITANTVTQRARYFMHLHGMKGGIHRCRHTFATRALAASDGDLLVVRDLLRHASVATTQIYTQIPRGKPFEVVARL